MRQDDAFRINGPQVIYENIDGEVVLINLQHGTYYSTDQVGTEMWSMVEAGLTASEIATAILARYEGDPADVADGVAAFLRELQSEELIVPIEPAVIGSAGHAQPGPGAASARRPYQRPVLNKYSDMKDMLLLDPIHDVEETGWPTPKANS